MKMNFFINKDFDFDSIGKSPIEKLKYKLIRKIGHFKRTLKGGHFACNQYFYDGAYCISEVRDLIIKKIIELNEFKSFNTELIVYHCPESPWLIEALYKTDGELARDKTSHSLDYKGKYDLLDLKNSNNNENKILFIVDLIHSGETFKVVYKKLVDLFPKAQIKCISILNSGDTTKYEIEGESRIIQVSSNLKISVDFFLSVEQNNYPYSLKECPMCNYDLLPKVDSSYTGKDNLLSYEMWLMFEGAGYIDEDFPVTEGREEMKDKPHSRKMMEVNAAYLAFKFDNRISKHQPSLKRSTELIFICPDETKNEIEILRRDGKPIDLHETASGYFAECLKQLKSFQYFAIPRNIITSIQKGGKGIAGGIKVSEIPTIHPDFYVKLRQLPDDIILFDEFNNSGGTILTIIEILKLVNRSPIAYFPIFNFSPSKINSNSFENIPVLSLYEFDLKPTLANA